MDRLYRQTINFLVFAIKIPAMKKQIFSLLILLGSAYLLPAQDELSPIVYSVRGKVKYAPGPGAKLKKLRSGTELNPDGLLKIYPGARLGVYYDEEYAIVNQEGEKKVSAITSDVSLFKESDLAELFGEMVDQAVNPFFQVRSGYAVAGDPPPPPPRKKEKDGHGNKEYQVIRLQPSGGMVARRNIPFSWQLADPARKVKKFTFTLRTDKGETLLEKPVKGYDFELSQEDYRLEHNKTYRWQVIAQDDPGLKTPEVRFTFTEPVELAQIRNNIAKMEMHQTADPTARLLMEAAVLEQAQFLSEAYDLYQTAVKKGKKNQLPQLLFEAFRWRYDMIE